MKTKHLSLIIVLLFLCGCAEEKTTGDVILKAATTTTQPAETTTTTESTTTTTESTTTTEATTTTLEAATTTLAETTTTTVAPTTTIAPVSVPTTNPNCKMLWYYDNDNKNCRKMEFCGDYEYSGLKTFDSMYECVTGEEFDPGEELTSSPD